MKNFNKRLVCMFSLLDILLCVVCLISVIFNVYVAVWFCEYDDWLYTTLKYWSAVEVCIFIWICWKCNRNSA